jgi:abhydrolase domain-containing protein 12
VHDAEPFGFAKGQVTPFAITTPDGQTLYAWHVLPLDIYIRNAESLSEIEHPQGPVEDFTKTLPFELLSSTSTPARVVINCELPLVMSLKAGEQIPTVTWPFSPTPM